MPQLKFYKINQQATLPEYATEQSACFDICFWKDPSSPFNFMLYSKHNAKIYREFADGGKILITPNERALVPTGLIADIPKGYSLRMHTRSGLALKSGIVLANQEAVIDSDYVEPLMILLRNVSKRNIAFSEGDRICQGELVKTVPVTIKETTKKPEQKTSRVGGMGSTGV